jgi:hypothetical protein
LAVVFAMIIAAGPACAGWITIRNDTKAEISVQEAIVVNGRVKLGKAVKLLPGESLKEHRANAGSKTVVVAEATKPLAAIARGTLEWKKDDITFSIKSDATGTTISAVK